MSFLSSATLLLFSIIIHRQVGYIFCVVSNNQVFTARGLVYIIYLLWVYLLESLQFLIRRINGRNQIGAAGSA